MKVSFFLFFVSVFLVFAANNYAQNTKLTLSMENTSIADVLQEIEDQSEFKFFYNNQLVDVKEMVSVEAKKDNIWDVLNQILPEAGITYHVMGNQIALFSNVSVSGNVILQPQTITGKVTDKDGNSLPGVTIMVKGLTEGTIADADGNYAITIPEGSIVLVFSFIGMKTQEIMIGNQKTINIILEYETIGLEEVVMIGYGIQKRSDLTSAIATISEDEIKNIPVASWASAIQGVSPGVEIQGNRGHPGSGGTIRIRGVGSINSTNPLIVVDGVPMGSGTLMPNDIQSVQVLKDAASCAIYGSRGANGVILITTKKGKKGEPSLSINSYYGVEQAWNQLELMNAQEWADLAYDVNNNAGRGAPSMAEWIRSEDSNYDGTSSDWQDAMFQTGTIQDHNLSMSGGTDAGNYYISAGYFNQEGIMLSTAYERLSLRVNSTWKKGNFTLGENIGFRYYTNEQEDNYGGRSLIEAMLKETAPVKILDPTKQGGYGGPTSADGHDANNPVGLANRIDNRNYNRLFSGSLFGDYEIIPGLNYKLTVGFSSTDSNNRNWRLATDLGPKSINHTELSETHSWNYGWAIENTITWQKTIGGHEFTALAGYTSEYSRNHYFGASGKDIESDVLHVLGLTESEYAIAGNESEFALASMLGRVLYSHKGKYYLTANVRRDGVSKFSKDNRWGVFPSVSAGWEISEEGFMNGIGFLDDLKLRGSFGLLGNQAPIGNYQIFSRLITGANATFNNGGTGKLIGVTPRNFSNSDLKWETVKQLDIGLDATVLNNSLVLVFDYYNKVTEDMLVSLPIPASSGSLYPVPMNAGSVKNTGIEFMATYRKSFGDLNLNISGNFATINNEVVSLGVEGGVINAGIVEFNTGGVTRTEEGHPIGSFYGYVTDGIFQNEDEVTAHGAQPNAQPGDIRFKDLDSDGSISLKDRDFIGSPIPEILYGAGIAANWKGFDFTMFFQGVYGNEIYSELVAWTEGMHNNFNGWKDAVNRFPYDTESGIPRAVRDDPNGNIKKASTRYIKDGSYLRLKTLVFGYTFSQPVMKSIHLSDVRFYFSGRNLLTFTSYPFYDPEIGSGALGTSGSINTSRGIDNGYYPHAMTITFGVQIDF